MKKGVRTNVGDIKEHFNVNKYFSNILWCIVEADQILLLIYVVEGWGSLASTVWLSIRIHLMWHPANREGIQFASIHSKLFCSMVLLTSTIKQNQCGGTHRQAAGWQWMFPPLLQEQINPEPLQRQCRLFTMNTQCMPSGDKRLILRLTVWRFYHLVFTGQHLFRYNMLSHNNQTPSRHVTWAQVTDEGICE